MVATGFLSSQQIQENVRTRFPFVNMELSVKYRVNLRIDHPNPTPKLVPPPLHSCIALKIEAKLVHMVVNSALFKSSPSNVKQGFKLIFGQQGVSLFSAACAIGGARS